MKNLALIIGVLAVSINLMAQEVSNEDWKQMSRQERKEYRMKTQKENHQNTMILLASRAWVLEADQIQDRSGESAIVEPGLNFVGVAGDQSTVQLGSSGEIGWNGLGGITLDGQVRTYDLRENKKEATGANVKLEVSGSYSGHISLSIQVSPDGTAQATVTDNFGERITYRGRIVPIAESRAFKGFALH